MTVAVGEVTLLDMPVAADPSSKLRPAVVLALLPGPYQRLLVAGVSTQFAGLVADWDEVLDPAVAWFPATGLHRRSAVRLSFLVAVREASIVGRIGLVPADLVERLRRRLALSLA